MLLSIRLFNLFCDRTSEFVCLFVLIFRSFFWSFSFSFYHKLPPRCFFLNTFEFCLILKKEYAKLIKNKGMLKSNSNALEKCYNVLLSSTLHNQITVLPQRVIYLLVSMCRGFGNCKILFSLVLSFLYPW
uniref:Uncharacterized protein n=1 Tax=Rousettus aegyptiacus TaxID=9407 RepID=A0A7J8JHC0_ROUAE|nr:hypothetical protein HJG63_010195 [Rousettus aegyptiacus]